MHQSVMIVVALLLAVLALVEGLNLADVPCGNMDSDSRRYFQRVMGGSVAEISDFPYAVSIKKHGEHHCGGSLVSLFSPSWRFSVSRLFSMFSLFSQFRLFRLFTLFFLFSLFRMSSP